MAYCIITFSGGDEFGKKILQEVYQEARGYPTARFSKEDEHTILLLFGDHQPVTTEYSDLISEYFCVGYNNALDLKNRKKEFF